MKFPRLKSSSLTERLGKENCECLCVHWDMEMVVKKGNTSDTKVKNGAAKTNRAKGNESSSLLDKNGNVLPAENRSKREEKCQIKRQGLKATINTETNRKDSKALPPSGELITSHESSDGTIYELEDCVYIDSQRPDVPFFICAIKEFRMCKRECLYVGVKWFYRPSEVPESVYQLLVQDRNTENGSRDHVLEDSSVKERELFVSDAVDTYSVSALRGKCKVKCLSEVPGLKEFISHNDNFFYVLRYNPETRRLANHKGEIRVGPSHQVLLPECKPKDEASNESSSLSLKEELTWRPSLDDYDLMMFVGAARSMAQYAGICKEGDTNKGLTVAARDATTINALKVLHESKYDTAQALQALVKRPFPKTSSMNWTDDEMKRFVKGLRQHGKNFYKIKKELLPQKETGDLVEYYYIWKKTQSAVSSRPHRRRRHNVLRRRNLTRAAKASSSEFLVLSSCSEDEYDSEDSEIKDLSLYCCRYCYSSNSKSWHHGGYDRLILCNECLTYFKKYGVMRKIGEVREPPPYMFKVIEKENDEDYYVNGKQLRSRRSTPNISGSLRYGRSKACSPLDAVIAPESLMNGRKLTRLSKPDSPSGASTGSNTSSSSSTKKSQPAKRRRTKKTSEPSPEKILPPKRKKSITRESDEEETDQSEGNSSPAMDQESVAVEGDAISISSRTSTNEEARASPPLETIEPEHECEAGKFPARKVVDGETSARTALPFTPNKKPVVRTEENKETGERKSKEKKHENEECSTQRSQKPENRTPSETVTASATVTSHQEHLRKYMAAGAYSRYSHGYPGMPVHAAPMMQMSLQNPCDAALLQWQLHSGLKDFRDAKDFENWYAPYKVPRVRNNPTHPLPPSLFHSAPLMDGQRNSPLHRHKDGILLPGGPTPLGTDPLTGLPQHHSHSHVHTHYHLHPGEQHLNQPRSPSLSLEPNWMWRNNHVTPGHEMWLHPQMLSGHGRHLLSPGEEFNGISPYFPGLYPPSREYQLQHELMSQNLKIDHGYTFYHPFLSASREHSMRYVRPHDRQPRLGTIDEPSASLLHRADARSMRSPSLKNFESGSHMLSTNQKPPTIHPILVDDD